MGNKNRLFGWLLSFALSLGFAQNSGACAFHGYTPNPTLIDILLATEQVVIARPEPSNPSQYTPIETLAGPEVINIPIGVTPATRVLLAGKPSATVLLARDGSYGPWLEIAVLDNRYRKFVSRILRQQSELLLAGGKKRLLLFAALVNDPNPGIRRLALQELDRAPYSDLKSLRLPKIQNLGQDLENGDEDLMPIRVLLAGLSQDRSFTRIMNAKLDAAIQNDVPYLGAYATALIELEGAAAVRKIFDRQLNADNLSADNREKLLQAMAIQYKTAPKPTRNLIARELTEFARISPDFAEAAARQFGFRGHRSQAVQELQR